MNDRRFRSGADLKAIRRRPPDAFVIDLARMFSHGREVALALRSARATRSVPLVFVDGEPDKRAALERLLPDASYTTWARTRGTLRRAIASPPRNPRAPGPMAGYAGTPLLKKLGIASGMTVALADAPANAHDILTPIPADVRLTRRPGTAAQLVIWFVRSQRALDEKIARRARDFADGGALWIAWPKRASGVATDVTQTDVRRTGLAHGLVDYKIAAIDDTWSGLKFARRDRSRTRR